jgi:hypothetical protein
MGKSFPGAGRLFGIMVVAALGTATVESHSVERGYLASKYTTPPGPVTLRFQSPRSSNPVPLPPLIEDDSNVPTADISNASEANPGWTNPNASLMTPDDSMESMLPPLTNSSTNSFAPAATANDLLIITPQMMVDYFRPLHGSTNGVGVSVPVPVNFLPPIVPAPAAPLSSSATYKVQ